MKATKTLWFVHYVLLMMVLSIVNQAVHAQPQTPLEIREARFKKLENILVYPLIKGGPLSGVVPVENISIMHDPKKEVKLVFDFSQATSKGNQAVKMNEGLEEVARILNLHIAAGVKKDNLKAVIVFHAGSITSVFTNDYYQKNFQANNPNLEMLNQLKSAGVEMVICGQSLGLRDVPHNWLLPEIKIALAAKTTLTMYDKEGYYGFEIVGE